MLRDTTASPPMNGAHTRHGSQFIIDFERRGIRPHHSCRRGIRLHHSYKNGTNGHILTMHVLTTHAWKAMMAPQPWLRKLWNIHRCKNMKSQHVGCYIYAIFSVRSSKAYGRQTGDRGT